MNGKTIHPALHRISDPRLRRVGLRIAQGYRDIAVNDGKTIQVQDNVDLFRSKLLNYNLSRKIQRA